MKTPDPRSPESGDDLDRLLEQARGDGFHSGQIEALWSRVAPLVAPVPTPHGAAGASGASGATATSGALAGGFGLKTLGALIVGGGLVAAAAGTAYVHRAARPAERAPTSAAAPPRQSPAPAIQQPAVASDESSLPTVAVSDLPSAAVPARPMTKGRLPIGSDGRDAPHPAARALAEREAPVFAPEPNNPADGPTMAAQSPRTSPDPGSGATPPALPAPNEGALLLRARQALDTDPASTLALTQEVARRFPTGTLAPEREVLAIEALARLGRTSDARARLDSFRARYPQSPHLARLDALITR